VGSGICLPRGLGKERCCESGRNIGQSRQSGDDRKPLQALQMVRLARRIARWTGSATELYKFLHS
jgi:hypothetical protein